MGLRQRISDVLSAEEAEGSAQCECDRCGATYDRPETPCEACGSDVMVPLE